MTLLHKCRARLLTWSSRPWIIASVLALAAGLLAMMQLIGQRFAAETGYLPFDFQNDLSVAAAAAQLRSYTARATQLYYAMAALDFAFPLAGGVFWCLLLCAGLRLGWPAWFSRSHKYWLALPFTGTLLDWTENIFNLLLISRYPPFSPELALGSVLAKQGKLGAVMLTATVTLLILAVGALGRWRRR